MSEPKSDEMESGEPWVQTADLYAASHYDPHEYQRPHTVLRAWIAEDMEANRKREAAISLISAAPDLYKELETMTEVLRRLTLDEEFREDAHPAVLVTFGVRVKAGLSALAKARGA